jgi:hypothetical protein
VNVRNLTDASPQKTCSWAYPGPLIHALARLQGLRVGDRPVVSQFRHSDRTQAACSEASDRLLSLTWIFSSAPTLHLLDEPPVKGTVRPAAVSVGPRSRASPNGRRWPKATCLPRPCCDGRSRVLETGPVTAPGTASVLAGFRFPREVISVARPLVPAVRAVLSGCRGAAGRARCCR